MSRVGTLIDEMVAQLKLIVEPTYPLTFGQVVPYDVPILENDQIIFPLLSIIDNGQERKRIDKDYNGFTRFDAEILIKGAVRTDTVDEIYGELSKLEAGVKQLIDSEPTLSNVLQWKFTETIDRIFEIDHDQFVGAFVLRTRVIYTASSGVF